MGQTYMAAFNCMRRPSPNIVLQWRCLRSTSTRPTTSSTCSTSGNVRDLAHEMAIGVVNQSALDESVEYLAWGAGAEELKAAGMLLLL